MKKIRKPAKQKKKAMELLRNTVQIVPESGCTISDSATIQQFFKDNKTFAIVVYESSRFGYRQDHSYDEK